jgi:hypothetical protein
MIGRSIWEIDMRDRYGRSDINEISIGISLWDMDYRYGIWYIDMVISHIDMGYHLTLGGIDHVGVNGAGEYERCV